MNSNGSRTLFAKIGDEASNCEEAIFTNQHILVIPPQMHYALIRMHGVNHNDPQNNSPNIRKQIYGWLTGSPKYPINP